MSAVSRLHVTISPSKPLSLKDKSKPQFADVAIRYLSTSSGLKYMILYPTDVSIRWARWINPNLPKEWDGVQVQAKAAQKILKVAHFPAACQKFIERCKQASVVIKEKKPTSEIAAATIRAGLGAALLAQPVSSFLYLGDKSRILPLSPKGLTLLKGASGIGVVGFSGESLYNIVSDATSLVQKKTKWPFLTGAKIVRNLSLLGIGVSSLFTIFSTIPAAAILLLVFSTVNLIFTLGIYFADQLLNPALEEG